MSCCSSGTCSCPVQPCPSTYISWLPRIAFGLMIAGFGVNHYRNFEGFMAMAKGAFPTVPALAMIAGLLAYIVPALMIVGGLLFAIKQQACVSKVCIVAALSGIIGWAGVALMVGPAEIGASAMPAVQFAAIVFLLYFKVKKMGCCGKCPAPAMMTK